mgnify:FL=1
MMSLTQLAVWHQHDVTRMQVTMEAAKFKNMSKVQCSVSLVFTMRTASRILSWLQPLSVYVPAQGVKGGLERFNGIFAL